LLIINRLARLEQTLEKVLRVETYQYLIIDDTDVSVEIPNVHTLLNREEQQVVGISPDSTYTKKRWDEIVPILGEHGWRLVTIFRHHIVMEKRKNL
jgi:hypothetical protein